MLASENMALEGQSYGSVLVGQHQSHGSHSWNGITKRFGSEGCFHVRLTTCAGPQGIVKRC